MAGMIPQTDIERVRTASPLADVVSERISLSQSGGRFWALCPFHDESSKSFSISANVELYHCFGCGVGGDVFTFLRELDSITFAEAVEKLAARSGIQISYEGESAADRNRRRMRPRVEEVMQCAVDFYASRLRAGSDSAPARAYLLERGYDADVAGRFGLGWAPSGWDATAEHLKSSGFRVDEITESGIAKPGSRGSLVDHLRGRVVFPIFDADGKPIAVAGRILPDAVERDGRKQPKYVNSPETSLYAKSRTLYGLNWAKQNIVERREVVVVEGYTDVIGFHLADATNTVATCGTALGEGHLRLLKRWTTRIVLAFDGDKAGEGAMERIFDIAFELGLDVRVAMLPNGRDPADLASDGPEAVAEALATTRPLLEFKVDRVLASIPNDSVENRSRALSAAAEVIAKHPDPIVRSNMARILARRLHGDVTEDVARRQVESIRARAASGRSAPSTERRAKARSEFDSAPATGPSAPPRPWPVVDEFAIAGLIQAPRVFFGAYPDVSPESFRSAPARQIAAKILAIAAETTTGAVELHLCDFDERQLAIARRLAVWAPPGFPDTDTFVRDGANALLRSHVENKVRELERACQVADMSNDTDTAKALDEQLVAFIRRRQELVET